MKFQKLNIILIILLVLSFVLNIFLLKNTFVNQKEIKEKKLQYEIVASFFIEYPEDDEIKYYDDISEELLSIVKTKDNITKINNEYDVDINNNIIIEPTNEFNTSYKITIILEQQEKLVSICKKVINILKLQKEYNIHIIDGPDKNSISKIR